MENNADDYSNFDETPVANEQLAQLDRHVREVQELEAQATRLASDLKRVQEQLSELQWRKVPDLMKEIGLTEFKHTSGLRIKIKEHITASITEERKAEAHAWLEDNGHAGLLKRTVAVQFLKDQQEEAEKLVGDLSKTYGAVTQDVKVHPSSLKAWVKGLLKEGSPLPLDLFGVVQRNQAEFTRGK